MRRKQNEMGDYLINGRLSIKELYELAKSDGYEDRELVFFIKNEDNGELYFSDHVVDFGKGWGHMSATIHIKLSNIDNKKGSIED